MHWDGEDYVTESASNFNGAATLAGSSPAVVSYWMRTLSELRVGCISRKDVTLPTGRSRYIELRFFPTYGFRFVFENDAGSLRTLEQLAAQPADPFHKIVALGGPWFYFEGYLKMRGVAWPRLSPSKSWLAKRYGDTLL
jgi:hypothetical protein